MKQRGFVIIDFGSQVTQLIARRLREFGFYSEIVSYLTSADVIKEKNPYGIFLSGGPNSVYDVGSPRRSIRELETIAPIFGICYGMQLLAIELGGEVKKSEHREYGLQLVHWQHAFGPIENEQKVWMSHGDVVAKAPPGFEFLAFSVGGHPAAMGNGRVLAVQFHPEVAHTEKGPELLKYFCENICHAQPDWQAPQFKEQLMKEVIELVPPNEEIMCALSGGVDSTVVATLLTKALGANKVHCVFVNNGLLRHQEYERVLESYKTIGLNIHGIDAEQRFLEALAGKIDPEDKRKAIGKLFIDVFEDELKQFPKAKWLAQGTLYPDVIESVSSVGGSVTIKSHHNVGGLPEKMKLKLIEPVRQLFKDEVRSLGKELGLPFEMIGRHPFPGPGLSIRVIGEVTKKKLDLLRACDEIYINYLKEKNLYHKIWQAFCVLLPIQTVGVQGDGRTYDQVLALRAVTSSDGMTADWYPFEYQHLREISNRITNQVRGVSRVVYDVTSKPPATIEWE